MTTLQPIRILLVRHGQSEANLDKAVNLALPDCAVPLSRTGHAQARAAGDAIAAYLGSLPDDARQAVRLLVSPYRRTRETAAGISEGLTAAGISHDRREDLALREIEFGLFDGIPDEDLPKVYPQEYAYYQKHLDVGGKEAEFFARMPLGESRATVADRVHSVFGTILRDAAPMRPNPIRTFVVVSHGVTLRCFRMRWHHHEYEWYAGQKNPQNCSVMLIEGVSGEGYREEPIFAGFPADHSAQSEREEKGTV